MATAYKCDGCKRFQDGASRASVSLYDKEEPAARTRDFELCSECTRAVQACLEALGSGKMNVYERLILGLEP